MPDRDTQDGVLFLIERVLPVGLEATPVARAGAFWDLQMLIISGGLERTEEQFRATSTTEASTHGVTHSEPLSACQAGPR